MKFMPKIAGAALAMATLVSPARAEDATEGGVVINNFSFIGVEYAYRQLRHGYGDGSSHEAVITLSKEWTVARPAHGSVGIVLGPSISYANSHYTDHGTDATTMDIGGRVGIVTESVTKASAIMLFVDASWQRDDVQGTAHKYGIGLEPGILASFRVMPKTALVAEFKYIGFSDVDRVENGASCQARLGGLFVLSQHLGLEVGGVIAPDSRDTYRSAGGYLRISRAF